jgi:MoxR-like ATPase
MMTKADKRNIIKTAIDKYGLGNVAKKDLNEVAVEFGFAKMSHSFLKDHSAGYGVYSLASLAAAVGVPTNAPDISVSGAPAEAPASAPVASAPMTQKIMASTMDNIVPEKDPLYVKTNEYKMIEKIVSSRVFYPVFITGLSGNGKSLSVIQAAAHTGRELVRINVTAGTDEDDLIGSFRLINGETVWQDGPMVEAMRRGALVLIDEIDMLNPNKAAALFTILEGKGVFIKKINALIKPAAGFNVIATANTKGKGSEDGRFMGTNVLNEAFLERFPITLEYEYPGKAHEKKIMNKVFTSLGLDDTEFVENLVDWASALRKSFLDGATDELISTRRLVHIAKAYSIFGDKEQAIRLCINRFDDETKESFWDFYTKIDAKVIAVDDEGNEVARSPEESELTEDNPF